MNITLITRYTYSTSKTQCPDQQATKPEYTSTAFVLDLQTAMQAACNMDTRCTMVTSHLPVLQILRKCRPDPLDPNRYICTLSKKIGGKLLLSKASMLQTWYEIYVI
jgi:hypothetical protein